MSIIKQFGLRRTLFLAVLAFTLTGTASAKTICNQCKGTGKILEVTKQCPLHQPLSGYCANCDGSGLIGPPCPYCGGVGYILTPAEKEAEKKARAAADAKAQAEHDEWLVKKAEEKRVEDSIKAVNKAKSDSIIAERIKGARGYPNIKSTMSRHGASLRMVYNQRLRNNPELKGTMEVKFSINEFGKVVSAQVVSSTLNDTGFENDIISLIKNWDFGRIDVRGDITTATLPINFFL